ncbi:MogA/MoaB family molybdenum cofactor biosynthesis protein [Caldicellulosiruptor morganii]|uniref:MogA/MoaB family molybdenum cofactor biosynthesis protein n=1 Tax=Caldicellulosiruptor morganii TaxID=1387555 RepID=A0ABY7BSC5_9FIRM|nr:MogA/MoaB family molybdenum cofactor biosynthesis protein [Caldicellulosiruptor morganii]WAM34479.1 MogA/MoaB family molybdenum cofactor biosynthesis protein [Caldicellulosiruptor morganii]
MPFTFAVITCSDRSAKGEREDLSGKEIMNLLKDQGFVDVYYKIVPDEKEEIKKAIVEAANSGANLILTTGGTGFYKRDVTPEATLEIVQKQTPGISELIRYETGKINKRSYLSRGVSGIYENSLIINLPGSPKAVKECIEAVLPLLEHGLNILLENERECGKAE